MNGNVASIKAIPTIELSPLDADATLEVVPIAQVLETVLEPLTVEHRHVAFPIAVLEVAELPRGNVGEVTPLPIPLELVTVFAQVVYIV